MSSFSFVDHLDDSKSRRKINAAENCGLMFGQVINCAWEKERKKIING